MVTYLWTFVYPIGCNGKIELWPIKSIHEVAVTLFRVCLAVFTLGVHMSDIRLPGSVVSKIIWLFRWKSVDFNWKCLLLLWPWQRSNWLGWWMLTGSSSDVSTFKKKIFQTQRGQFVPHSKVPNVKSLFDPSDLENKVKVNLMTFNDRFCHYTSLV